MSIPHADVHDPGITYHDLTFHAVAVIQQLQQPWEKSVKIERAGGLVLERPAALRAVTPRMGAEIGTHRGKNAASLLARMPNLTLFMIDPYGGDPEHSLFYQECVTETAFAANRRRIVHAYSPQAADQFSINQFDFVFIDGDHSFDAALADFYAWWPKVKSGGWLFGHDYQHPQEKELGWGVTEAADEFCMAVSGLRPIVYEPRAMTFGLRKP